jgi:predicted ATPase
MMMLEQFTVENFKAFKHLELKDLGHINIFVGDNNVGKTCLLQAIGLHEVIRRFKPSELRRIDKEGNPETGAFIAKVPTLLTSTIGQTFNFSTQEKGSLSLSGKESFYKLCPVKMGESYFFQVEGIQYPVLFDMNRQENQEIELPEYFESNDLYYFPTSTNFRQLAIDYFQNFFEEGREHEIYKFLRDSIEPRLDDIVYIGHSRLRIRLQPNVQRLPLSSMGDGFIKLMGLFTCLKNNNSTLVFIDEPENGFHYKTQTSFWKLLANWSLEGDKQSFIATHSYELIRCLNDLLTADPTLLERGLKVRVHRLKRDEEDMEKIHVVTIAEEGIAALLEMNLELR